MQDAATTVAGVLIVVAFLYWRYRRWSNMTPDQRKMDALTRKTRKMERDLRRHRTYGG